VPAVSRLVFPQAAAAMRAAVRKVVVVPLNIARECTTGSAFWLGSGLGAVGGHQAGFFQRLNVLGLGHAVDGVPLQVGRSAIEEI
jgi:hypothetical protein